MEKTKEKVIGYCRISSTAVKKGQARIEGENNSIEVQTKKIIEYCQYKGLDLIEIIQDEDISGGKEFNKREGGMKAQQHFDNGVKTIIGIRIDRFFRNVKDSLINIEEWNKQKIALHIIEMGGSSFNTRTATGKLIFTIMVANSAYEREVCGERTSSILNNKKDTHKVFCNKIIGYDKVNGQLIPNEAEQAIIKKIFELKEEHVSINGIARILNRENIKTKTGKDFYPSTVKAILQNKMHSENR